MALSRSWVVFTFIIDSLGTNLYLIFSILELPTSAFVGIPELEVLNLEHTSLRTLALDEEVVGHLQLLQMDGNPLHCDCHSRWLWNIVATVAQNQSFIQLPNCETPFSAKGIPLSSLPGKQLPNYKLV